MTDILQYLLCPICGESLTRVDKSLRCPNRHTFDLSKSGYVNLLPPGKGKNAHTGDNKEMVEARVNFLKRGFYNRISHETAALVAEYASNADPCTICDMGAGEGWHSCRIAEETGALTGRSVLLVGVDASKYAAERASKLSRERGLMPREGIGAPHNGNIKAYFLPANLFHTPFPSAAFSAALSMFAPVTAEETTRILRDDGVLVVVSSGRDHLLELRQLIYSQVRLSEENLPTPDGFRAVETRNLRYTVTLPDKETIADLFMMTPFYYKTTETGKMRLLSKDSLDITVDVNYTVYRKTPQTEDKNEVPQ